VGTRNEAFEKYLKRANVPKEDLSIEDASALIRNAGGKIGLAHPCGKYDSLLKLGNDPKRHRYFIDSISDHIDFIECFHIDHDLDKVGFYMGICQELGLGVSAGSDHHGGCRDYIGKVNVPDHVMDDFMEFLFD